jgi:NAD(P)-dependent dehydrogenase (short-subunit alcohol dehydrogenase family)
MEGAEAGIPSNLVAPGFTVTEANLARFLDEVARAFGHVHPLAT